MRLAADVLRQPESRAKIVSYLAWNFHTQQGQCPDWGSDVAEAIFKPLEAMARARTVAQYPKSSFAWSSTDEAEVQFPLERLPMSLGSQEVFTERMVPVTQVSVLSGPADRIGYNDGLDEMATLVAHALVKQLPEVQDLFTPVTYAQFAAERGFTDRYADGSARLFDEVLPRVRLTPDNCSRLAARAAREWP